VIPVFLFLSGDEPGKLSGMVGLLTVSSTSMPSRGLPLSLAGLVDLGVDDVIGGLPVDLDTGAFSGFGVR
jgi:hypothetical protein